MSLAGADTRCRHYLCTSLSLLDLCGVSFVSSLLETAIDMFSQFKGCRTLSADMSDQSHAVAIELYGGLVRHRCPILIVSPLFIYLYLSLSLSSTLSPYHIHRYHDQLTLLVRLIGHVHISINTHNKKNITYAHRI